MRSRLSAASCVVTLLATASIAIAQSREVPGSLVQDLRTFVETPAVPGYEGTLAAKIRSRLQAWSPRTDNLGDVVVTVGSGAPHRLIVAPMDEPGYVVSRITPQGYLQLQRLPQFGILPLFNELYAAQPVRIQTASGKWINGVVAGLSIHLAPGRSHPPDPDDIANMYVDIGASSAQEARQAGASLLSPVAIDRTLYEMGGSKWTAPAVGDRFGDAALVEVLRRLDAVKIQGTLIVAFVAQQWAGARGLQRVLQSERPDELIYVGRMIPGRVLSTDLLTTRFPEQPPGAGVLMSTVARGRLASELTKLAAQHRIPLIQDYSAPLIPRSYLPPPPMPPRFVHLGIATAWSSSPGELIDGKDLSDLDVLLEDYLQGASQKPALPEAHSIPEPALPAKPETKPAPEAILKTLIETYGVSGHEAAVRAAVRQLLPPWAKPTTDSSGNLILHMAMTPSGALKPGILFDAHMDEIGYKVQSIRSGGDLGVAPLGGFLPDFYAGHVAFVHTSTGMWSGVVELPPDWRQPGIKWPRKRIAGAGAAVSPYRVDVGVRTAADASALGIKPGDTITIPKKYRALAGSCVSGRSLDDRVGDAALISAVWTLGPKPRDRNVTFVFSTREELGLLGAAALAKRLASEGRVPKYVFAIDTFVTSDSPLESPRFADAKVGRGFVVRAVDNSEIMPRTLVERVLRIAQENGIPAQYGVTGGGNDGSAFLRYGSADVALGWPMRYSHSPGEMIDTRDLDGLARIVAAIARQW